MSTLDEFSTVDTPIETAQFEEFLRAKRRKCPGCGSTELEAFIDQNGDQKASMFSTLPDENLKRYIPTLPAVCMSCGLINLYWVAVVRQWLKQST